MDSPTDFPRVVLSAVCSVDGRMAISPDIVLMAEPRWPTSDNAYSGVMRRHRPQVFLEGSGSFVTDDQGPAEFPTATESSELLHTDFLPAGAREKAQVGWLAVVDSRGRVAWQYKEFPGEEWKGWHILVLVCADTPNDYLSFLRREEIPYLVVGTGRVDLPAALVALRTKLAVATVACTGGARLGGALLRAGLIDEIDIEVLPMAVGGTTAPILFSSPNLGAQESPDTLRLIEATPLAGNRVLLRYLVEKPPRPR